MGNILTLIHKCENVSGDVIEFGTAKGGTAIIIARFLKSIGSVKKVICCDTFTGLPYEDKFSERINVIVKGRYAHSINEVQENIESFELADRIVLIEGLFEETLYRKLKNNKFSFAFVDCDLYDSTKFCLDFVWSRLNRNSMIIFDEYGGCGALDMKIGTWGEYMAAKEFCRKNNVTVQENLEPLIIKP